MRTTWMPSGCCSWMARSIHSSGVSIKMTSHSGCLTSLTRVVYNKLKMLTDFHAESTFCKTEDSLYRRFRLNRSDSPNSALVAGSDAGMRIKRSYRVLTIYAAVLPLGIVPLIAVFDCRGARYLGSSEFRNQ